MSSELVIYAWHAGTRHREASCERFSSASAKRFSWSPGPSGPETRERFHRTPGPRWFAPDRPIRRVHGDAASSSAGCAHCCCNTAPRCDDRDRAALGLPRRPLGPASAHQHLPRRDHLRHRAGRAAGRGSRPRHPRACQGDRTRWPSVPGRRPAPAPLGARRRGGQLPALPSALRPTPARRGRVRRVRGDIARIATSLGVPDPPRTRAELDAVLRETHRKCAPFRKPSMPPGS